MLGGLDVGEGVDAQRDAIMRENGVRRCFLLSSLALTLLGCVVGGLSMALPAWQVVDLVEFSAVHEHGVFYDCVHSDVTPLDEVDDAEGLARITKQCLHKSDSAASRSLHKAVEQEGDPAAREMLLHRSLPQHKAVIFFFIFMTIFSGIAMIVGACSPCFVPISILHVISVTLAMSCSIFGATIFWLASMRPDNRYLAGVANVYQQKLSYGFFVHCLGSFLLFCAAICSTGSAYLLIRREWRTHGCCVRAVQKSTSSRESYTHYPSLSFYNQRDSDVRLTSHLPSCSEYSPNASIVARMERHRPSYDPCAFPEEGV